MNSTTDPLWLKTTDNALVRADSIISIGVERASGGSEFVTVTTITGTSHRVSALVPDAAAEGVRLADFLSNRDHGRPYTVFEYDMFKRSWEYLPLAVLPDFTSALNG